MCVVNRFTTLGLLTAVVCISDGGTAPRTMLAAPPLVAPGDPLKPEEQQKKFKLPPGFEIQLVASDPDIRKPMNIAWDDQGRLWVTDTIEYPYPVGEGKKGRDAVKILEDFDANGKAKKITTFADGLNIPIGLLPLPTKPGSKETVAIVFSVPNIIRLTDADGDGKADKEEKLFGPIGQIDTHGLANSFTYWIDGWVYACHGFNNNSTLKGTDGHEIKLNSGNVFRFRPDGSRVEQFTWGQVNPFGLSFDSWGNIFTADCHSRPVTMLLRGGWYPSFSKPHDGLGFAPEMCKHDHGSTGIAGCLHYSADQFPAEYRDTIFVGNVVTNRINHDKLERKGSTLTAIDNGDFLTCEDPWFRPVYFNLGPDGAIYVCDFYNCIIGHYEVPLDHPKRDRERGRIWRIVYKGKDGKGEAKAPRGDWTKASINELIEDLKHPNLTVRVTATHQLVLRGNDAAKEIKDMLAGSPSREQRLHALWVLERLNPLDDKQLKRFIEDKEPIVRVQAQRVISERFKLTEDQRKMILSEDGDCFTQRAAVEVMAVHPHPDHVAALFKVRQQSPKDDLQLIHSVRMALRNQFRSPEGWSKWNGEYKKNEADSKAVTDVMLGLADSRSAEFLFRHLVHWDESNENILRYSRHVARYGPGSLPEELVGYLTGTNSRDLDLQVAYFRAFNEGIQQRGGKLDTDGREWGEGLVAKLLASEENDKLGKGFELAAGLRPTAAEKPALVILQDKQRPENVRRLAASALTNINGVRHIALFARIMEDATEPLILREHLALQLGVINHADARAALLKCFQSAPQRLEVTVAVALSGTAVGAEELLKAVEATKASPRLLQEPPVMNRLKNHNIMDLEKRVAALTKNMPPAEKGVQELIGKRRVGYATAKADPDQGKQIFTKHCAACHQMANQGTKIGPQLDGIGNRGPDRLLEDILDPGRNVDEAFRSTFLLLDSGQTKNGLALREEGNVLILADDKGKEIRVAKNEIVKQSKSLQSPMPANWADAMPEQDFYHLMAYLLAQKAK